MNIKLVSLRDFEANKYQSQNIVLTSNPAKITRLADAPASLNHQYTCDKIHAHMHKEQEVPT